MCSWTGDDLILYLSVNLIYSSLLLKYPVGLVQTQNKTPLNKILKKRRWGRGGILIARSHKLNRPPALCPGPEVSPYSQTFLDGEAAVPDRHSRVEEGQRPSPHHHLRPTHRPQVGGTGAHSNKIHQTKQYRAFGWFINYVLFILSVYIIFTLFLLLFIIIISILIIKI